MVSVLFINLVVRMLSRFAEALKVKQSGFISESFSSSWWFEATVQEVNGLFLSCCWLQIVSEACPAL